MKNQKKKPAFPSLAGYSFLLTIMIILTLVVFAVLSLSASLRDYEYSRRGAEKTTAYYEANSKAYAILRQIDEKLMVCGSLEEAAEAVKELPEVTVTGKKEAVAVFYKAAINGRQELQVLLEVTENDAQSLVYEIKKWKETASDNWKGDAALPVLGNQ